MRLNTATNLHSRSVRWHGAARNKAGFLALARKAAAVPVRFGRADSNAKVRGTKFAHLPTVTLSRIPVFTCPGATPECIDICYALHGRVGMAVGKGSYTGNSLSTDPAVIGAALDSRTKKLPALLRLHVAGDFDSVAYIDAIIDVLQARPYVIAWGYTRSWREIASEKTGEDLSAALQRLQALQNVTLFASKDVSTATESATLRPAYMGREAAVAAGDTTAIVCPQQTGKVSGCADCGFCFGKVGKSSSRGVIFLKH